MEWTGWMDGRKEMQNGLLTAISPNVVTTAGES